MVRVGQLGAGFIGQMHSLALTNAGMSRAQPQVRAHLCALADRDAAAAEAAAERYGWASSNTSWESVLAHEGLDLFVNAGPNDLHIEPTVAAAERGLAVFCEKPLAASGDLAHDLWRRVARTGVVARTAFMHRFIPAVQLARDLVRSGEFGEARHFRSRFLMNMAAPDGSVSWRFDRDRSGAGAMGDLGSHHIDIARFTVGEVQEVGAMLSTWTEDPTGRITTVNDDAFRAVATLAGGVTATFEASRVAPAHGLTGEFEIDCTEGSVAWRMERLNELVIRRPGTGPAAQVVTRPGDPLEGFWLPSGVQGSHPLGWNECFAHQAHSILALVAGAPRASSPAATFEDGYRVAEIVDTIQRAAAERRILPVVFRAA